MADDPRNPAGSCAIKTGPKILQRLYKLFLYLPSSIRTKVDSRTPCSRAYRTVSSSFLTFWRHFWRILVHDGRTDLWTRNLFIEQSPGPSSRREGTSCFIGLELQRVSDSPHSSESSATNFASLSFSNPLSYCPQSICLRVFKDCSKTIPRDKSYVLMITRPTLSSGY